MSDFLSEVFGSKPQIADYTPVDLTQEQQDALSANISNFPQIAQMGDLFQTYLLGAYNKAIPGFSDILKMGGDTTKQMLGDAAGFLEGKIPQDVQDQIQRSSAFQSLMSGTSGSPMSKALTARDFGLTSLNLINQGANLAGLAGNAAQRWAALSGAQIPEGMLITPQQKAALDMQQNLIERNIQQQKFNVEAAPDPALQALNQWVEQVGGTILGAYASGGMSKGGDYKTTYNAGSYGAGDISQGTGATGSLTSSGVNYGGTGGIFGGAAPTSTNDEFALPANSYLAGGSSIPGYGYDFSSSPLTTYGGAGMDWSFNPYGTQSGFNVATAGTGGF